MCMLCIAVTVCTLFIFEMALRFDLQERINIVKNYYATDNAAEVGRLAGAHSPSRSTVLRLIKKFETTGSVMDQSRSGRPSLYNNATFQTAVLREINDNTPTSTRRISSQLAINSDFNVSYSTVYKTLITMKRKPYTPRLLQELNDDDPDRRLEACQHFQQMFENDPRAVDHIIWSDEAIFKLNGQINKHNCVYWNSENLHHTLQKSVNLPGLHVWCGISSDGIIGPYFFNNTVTGASYLKMLQDWFWPQVADRADHIYFQQDGAPPHYSVAVREWLDNHFPEAWIGRRGAMEWPARSPDLTPCDFFLWGVLKDRVYGKNPHTLAQLRTEIEDGIQEIERDLCQKVCRSVPSRINQCIAKNGGHFENYR